VTARREKGRYAAKPKRSAYPAQDLKRRVTWWAVRLRVNPSVIRVQEMTRKWGSCSTTGIVTLAADLIDQKPAFQDFVIVHELLHLRFRNHGRVFKAVLGAHVPSWRQHEVSKP
jgi:predicted metal-dependent hydrolase